MTRYGFWPNDWFASYYSDGWWPRHGNTYLASTVEQVAIDSYAGNISDSFGAISETVNVTYEANYLALTLVSYSDSLGVTDSPISKAEAVASLQDVFDINDALVIRAEAEGSIAENVQINGSMIASLLGYSSYAEVADFSSSPSAHSEADAEHLSSFGIDSTPGALATSYAPYRDTAHIVDIITARLTQLVSYADSVILDDALAAEVRALCNYRDNVKLSVLHDTSSAAASSYNQLVIIGDDYVSVIIPLLLSPECRTYIVASCGHQCEENIFVTGETKLLSGSCNRTTVVPGSDCYCKNQVFTYGDAGWFPNIWNQEWFADGWFNSDNKGHIVSKCSRTMVMPSQTCCGGQHTFVISETEEIISNTQRTLCIACKNAKG